MKTKICTQCCLKYPITRDFFYADKRKKDGLHSECRKCGCQSVKKYRQTEKGKQTHRKSNKKYRQTKKGKKATKKSLLKRHNMQLEDYKKLIEQQDGCCAICGKHPSKFDRILSIDHNHTTGKVRGLLCVYCNTGLGWLENNMPNVLKYQRSFDGQTSIT